MDRAANKDDIVSHLDQIAGTKVPGMQYIVVDADGALCEYAGGWADIRARRAMALDASMMAYSMTKTFTAIAILQLMERGQFGLDDEIDRHLPAIPYAGQQITIGHLVTHTSGIPNPIPLRWIHLAEEDASFDEGEALAKVLGDNPDLAFMPGEKFAYSNIGYWLLGRIIERITGESYREYSRVNVLLPLGLTPEKMDFVIPDPAQHSNGYLARYSLTNLIKGFVMDRRFWGDYEGNWLRLKNLHLNGPSYGGLVGTGRGFACFLQDQLKRESVVLGLDAKRLLETQQADNAGRPIPMTMGWHIGETNGVVYFNKEGGGGGFRSEMRLYPTKRIASVVMVNATNFQSSRFLDQLDRAFYPPK